MKNFFNLTGIIQRAAGLVISNKELAFHDKMKEKRAKDKESLRKTNEYLENLFRYTNAPIIVWDTQFNITRFNPAFETLTGRKADDVVGRSIEVLFPAEQVENLMELIRKTQEGERWETVEINILHVNNSVRTVLWNSVPMLGIDRKTIIATIAQGQDITGRKQAEDAMRQSRKELDSLFEASPEMISFIGFDGYFKRLNPAWVKTLGYPIEKLLSIPFIEFVHPDDREATNAEAAKLAEGQRTIQFDNRYHCNDGSYRWLSWSVIPDTKEKLLYAVARDITERIQAEKVIKDNETRFRELIESLPQLFWTCRVDGPCDYLSKQWIEYTGIQESKQLGYGWLEQLHPDDRDRTVTEWMQKVKTGDSFDIEFRIRRNDGVYHWFKTRAVPMRDAEGNIIKWFGSNTDFDEIKKAEEQLRNFNKVLEAKVDDRTKELQSSKQLLDESGRLARVGGWEIDLKANSLFWSETTFKIHEVDPGFVPNVESGINFYAPEAIPVISQCIDKAIKLGESFDVELELITAKKNRIWVRAVGEAYRKNGEIVKIGGMFQDINERKLAEIESGKKSEQLRLLSNELEIIIDSIPGLVFYKDTKNRYIRVNKYICDAHKMSKEQLEGTHLKDLYDKKQAQAYYEDDLQVIKSRKAKINIDESWETETGIRWVSTSKIPYIDSTGEVIGVIGISIDVTERKQAEEELKKYRDQLEDMVKTRTAALSNILTEVKETVNVLVSSTSEILAATTQVASGSAETATAISETTTTVEEVRQAALLSSQKASNVSENAQLVASVTQTGQKAVDETVNRMHDIQNQMEAVTNTIVRLSEQSQQIGGIIASVTDVADQSNLLAVNAAIEAAKAGEQGKGFAVVAQEIKSLAQQSKQATIQVRNILSDVQKATSAAVMATEQTSRAVENGVKQSAQVGEAIKKLAETSGKAVEAATQIVASSQQQLVGMDQIGLAMNNVNQAGAENAASMVQAEKSAKGLHELGMKLKLLVEQYKI
jgi:PAS domain S-box-containing protein